MWGGLFGSGVWVWEGNVGWWDEDGVCERLMSTENGGILVSKAGTAGTRGSKLSQHGRKREFCVGQRGVWRVLRRADYASLAAGSMVRC